MNNSYKFALVAWCSTLVIFMYGALSLPADALMPVHWNADFEIDRWVDKWVGLAAGPVLITILPLFMWLIVKIEPRQQHIHDSHKVLATTIIGLQLLLSLIYLGMVLTATGIEIDMGRWVFIGVGVLLALIGNLLGKVRSNFMLGIRTPWTLSSENVWNKTHRLGGKLFVLTGAIAVLAGVLGQKWAIYLFVGSVILVSLTVIVYSWWLYDQERKGNA